ncbi:hypothetical protein D3C78_504890 [compost metagenome]
MRGDVFDEVTHRTLVIVERVRLLFQGRHQRLGRLVTPVTEQQHIVALVAMRFRFFRFDDDRPVHPSLLLQSGMTVIPVGAALLQGELIEVLAPRLNAGKAKAWHAVHVGRQDDAVPVQRCRLGQAIAHAQGDSVAFTPAQHRAGQAVVDGQRCARATGNIDWSLADKQVEVATAEGIAKWGVCGESGQAPKAETGQGATGGESFDEGAAGRVCKHGDASP